MRKKNGMTIALAAALAGVIAFLVIATANMLRGSSRESTYLGNMDRVYRLAETGLSAALGRLSVDPEAYDNAPDASPADPDKYNGRDMTEETGMKYRNTVYRRNLPIDGGYYIVTSATRTFKGRAFSTELHTYARVSNVGDYFAAVNDTLPISHPIDLSAGKVYAINLLFQTSSTGGEAGQTTTVDEATYAETVTPSTTTAGVYGVGQEVNPVNSPGNKPEKILPLTLPQVQDTDIAFYFDKAHGDWTDPSVGHRKCDFTGDVFPPGYFTAGCTGPGDRDFDDDYTGHTCDNIDHVYFCDGDATVSSATVRGQVLIVATGNVYLSSNVVQSSVMTALPGAGYASSSTAHQFVFLTRHDVIIKNTFYQVEATLTDQTQRIQALLIAPHGMLKAQAYPDGYSATYPAVRGKDIHKKLGLDFKGSLIMGTMNPEDPSDPDVIPRVFRRERTYSYNPELKDKPAPYLPHLVEIHYSFERTSTTDSIY